MPRYTIETRKELDTYNWTNTWHIIATNLTEALSAGTSIAAFEAAILFDQAQVKEVKASLWPNPSGQDFMVQVLNLPGELDLGAPEPAEMCVFLNIEAAQGHKGKKWIRMSLDEAFVTQVAGSPVFTPSGTWNTQFNDAVTLLGSELAALEVDLLIGSNPETSRVSTNVISTNGIGFRDRDIGWYNKEA